MGAGSQREESPLWAIPASRHLVNEPAELTLSRAGQYSRRADPGSLCRFLSSLSLDASNAANTALEWATNNCGKCNLNCAQLLAIRAYTLDQPPIYEAFNQALYEGGHHVPKWAGFLDAIDSGLEQLSRSQVTPSRLYRLAWIPDAILEHFKDVGSEIVLKACNSTSEEPRWEFLNSTVSKDTKTPVLLEFDSRACCNAAKITAISAFAAEREWLLRPYFRGVVREVGEATAPSGKKVMRICLDTLKEIPMNRAMFDDSLVPTERLLQLALFIALHAPDTGIGSAMFDGLQHLEEAIEVASPALTAEEVKRLWADYRKSIPIVFLALPLLAIPGVILPAALAVGAFAITAAAVEYKNGKFKHGLKKHVRTIKTAEELANKSVEDLQSVNHLNPPPPDCFYHQVRTHTEGYRHADTSDPHRNAEHYIVGALGKTPEQTRLLHWLRASLGATLIAKAVDGTLPVIESPFPLRDKPMKVAVELGERVFSSTPTEANEAARFAVARVMHLRLHLSRLRILFPLGLPDAGKSTLLKHVYGIDVPAGLLGAGRTAGFTIHPHPNYDAGLRPAFIADAPGFGDKELDRNDVMRLALRVACDDSAFRSHMRVLRVIMSGRHVESALDEVMPKLEPGQYFTVVTHADERFRQLCKEAMRELKGASREAKAKRREELADQIIAEDRQRLGDDCALIYACPVGWGSPDGDDDEDDEDEDRPPKAVCDDFRRLFKVISCKRLREELDYFMAADLCDDDVCSSDDLRTGPNIDAAVPSDKVVCPFCPKKSTLKSTPSTPSNAKQTGPLADGLIESRGVFAYEGTGWCQIYMTITYTNSHGDKTSIQSCDLDEYNWYNGEMRVELGATNIQVSFDVRGGGPVYAVDRSKESKPWRYDEKGNCDQEVFDFPEGNGIKHLFKIGGTSLHAYVYEECAINLDTLE